MTTNNDRNINRQVVSDFGREWKAFDYSSTETKESLDVQFQAYIGPIDLKRFSSSSAIAADFGAGSGRWTLRFTPYFKTIYAVEPSDGASEVLRKKFKHESRVKVLQESVGANSIPDGALDFAVSLGVLHHIPDTALAISDIAKKIKPGGEFLCYLYYKLEEKPFYYRSIFAMANVVRNLICRSPYPVKRMVSKLIAVFIYLPLARFSKLLHKAGRNIDNIPLHHYKDMPFYMLSNDALDRFGTRLEQRFNKEEIADMLSKAGFDLETLKFSEVEPFWTFSIRKLMN